MRLTVFALDGGTVRADVTTDLPWQPVTEWEGEPVTGMRAYDALQAPPATVQQAHLAAGGHFVLHAAPDLVVCQIVYGRGVLGLPDGRGIPYHGPELYVFQPEAPHEWRDITEDTLLTVCLVR